MIRKEWPGIVPSHSLYLIIYMSRSDQLACTSQGEVDVIADVVFANDLLEVVALQHVLDLGIDTREYDGDAFLLTHEAHVLEVV